MKIKENLREFFKKINILHVITFLLLILILIIYLDNRNLKNIIYSNYNSPCRHNKFFNKYYDRDLDREFQLMRKETLQLLKNIDREFEKRIERNLEKNKMHREIQDFKGKKQENQEEKNNQKLKDFKVILTFPKEIEREDIKIDLKNNNLTVSVDKKMKNENSSFSSNFFNSYFVKTKATMKDIKISFENSILKIMVPIL